MRRSGPSRRRAASPWAFVAVAACLWMTSTAWADEAPVAGATSGDKGCGGVLVGEYRRLASSERVDVCQAYGDRLVLVVNTASQCGFVGQFEGLEALYQRYRDQGLMVVGFPSNDFNQEHADENKTAEVCELNYGVSFPMMATTSVKGEGANPLFRRLTNASQAPGWNFNKYLINPTTGAVAHFGARAAPLAGALEDRIQAELSRWPNTPASP
ncbi:MAG: glutathione peroxidase [Wenzhouxiangella sp.]|nr:glutathione peroxidase [Wenzhouxiangella sp.]